MSSPTPNSVRTGTIRVGVARAEVNVPVGTAMAGFAARPSPSTGVHDQLQVNALVVDYVALVTVDCCALHEDNCSEIRALVTGHVLDVVVTATHTHSGPCLAPGRLGPVDHHVLTEVVRAAADTVSRAAASTQACTVSYAEAYGVGMAADRRHLDRSIDPPIQTIRFSDGSGRVIAQLASYPCHPVVLDARNTLISADYPARLRTTMEDHHPGSICLFATGAAGDINTGHSPEQSYNSHQETNRTFAEADRIGSALATLLQSSMYQPITTTQLTVLQAASVQLPFAAVDLSAVAAETKAWKREMSTAPAGRAELLRNWINWADYHAGVGPATWKGRVGLIRLGELSVITLPGEPFWAVAEAIRSHADGPTIVLGYSDGVPGYFPSRDDYPQGGYEVCDAHRYYGMPAPFAVGCAERLVAAADALIND